MAVSLKLPPVLISLQESIGSTHKSDHIGIIQFPSLTLEFQTVITAQWVPLCQTFFVPGSGSSDEYDYMGQRFSRGMRGQNQSTQDFPRIRRPITSRIKPVITVLAWGSLFPAIFLPTNWPQQIKTYKITHRPIFVIKCPDLYCQTQIIKQKDNTDDNYQSTDKDHASPAQYSTSII